MLAYIMIVGFFLSFLLPVFLVFAAYGLALFKALFDDDFKNY